MPSPPRSSLRAKFSPLRFSSWAEALLPWLLPSLLQPCLRPHSVLPDIKCFNSLSKKNSNIKQTRGKSGSLPILTGLRAGTAPLSTVEEVGRADTDPLLLLLVVVVVALPPPAVVDVTVVVELFGFVVLAALGRVNEGTLGTVPVFEESVVGFTVDLAAAVGPVEAGVLLNELVVETEEAAEPALEAEPESVEEAGLVLVVVGAGFDAIPDVDDAGLDAGLVDGVVFVLPSVVVVVGLLGVVPAAGLAEVFLITSVAEEEVTRVLDPALLREDPVFAFPDKTSVF